jgi:hypothetical protein
MLLTIVCALLCLSAQVPHSCLQPLLRAMFLRFICLMTVSKTSSSCSSTACGASHTAPTTQPAGGSSRGGLQAGTAAVLAYRYGSVLLELLGGVLGCAGHLHDAFSVEVQHLVTVPQVSC